ncbi:phage protein GemA/Gp16 family protein [Brevibacillus sp. SYSU BS000544]|uniref:phage protein GemA/Gp16 family protein n=1 Tax=Brevibacillus sp. SYSU BS000544 TaxID=3416443 RepID=UPI003CE54DD0
MIERKQLAVLHIAKKDLSLDDDVYRQILQQEAGVSSSRDLSLDGFRKVMKRLEHLGYKGSAKPKQTRNKPKDPNAIVGPWQAQKIRQLFAELGWHEPDRQQGFTKKMIGKPWAQTRSEANKIIEGLKAMIKRQTKGDAQDG